MEESLRALLGSFRRGAEHVRDNLSPPKGKELGGGKKKKVGGGGFEVYGKGYGELVCQGFP